MFRILLVALATGVSASKTATHSKSSISKVIEMLNDMLVDGKSEKQKEKVAFAVVSQQCSDVRANTENEIKEGKSKIVQLGAQIDKAKSDSAVAAKTISDLSTKIGDDETRLTEAQKQRKDEASEYLTTHKDYEESLDALGNAIMVLEQSMSNDEPTRFLQLKSSSTTSSENAIDIIEKQKNISSDMKQTLRTILLSQPKAKVYEQSKSGGVVAMLEKLKSKFVDEMRALEKDEANRKGSFQLLKQNLMTQIKNAKSEMSEQEEVKSLKDSEASDAQGSLSETEAALAEDEKLYSENDAECKLKSQEYEANQKTRGEEIIAINKAIEIMGSDDVSGDKFIQTSVKSETKKKEQLQVIADSNGIASEIDQAFSSLSFMQEKLLSTSHEQLVTKLATRYQKISSNIRFSSASQTNNSEKQLLKRAIEHIFKRIHNPSNKLQLITLKMQESPFKKVTKMIEDMIVKLMEEANAEAEEKGWCDTELGTNKLNRENASSKLEELNSEIEEKSATHEKLSTETSTLNEQISALNDEIKEADKIRVDENKRNLAAIEEAKAGQEATDRAISVLQEFYGKQSFLQVAGSAPYKGMGGSSGGVIGMLQTIASDFARVMTETQTAEDQNAEAHQKFLDESSEDSAVKNAELVHKQKKMSNLKTIISELKVDVGSISEKLDIANKYFEELKPKCIDAGQSYEERVEERKAEIESLQEALEILDVK